MVSTTDIEAAWHQDGDLADDHMTPRIADLVVRLFADHGLASEVVGLGGGLVGVELRNVPGVSPDWAVVTGLVEEDGWWMVAESDSLPEQPPIVMLGHHEPGDAVRLVVSVAPRLQRDLGVDHSLTLDDLARIAP